MEDGRMPKSQPFSSNLGMRAPTLLWRHARSHDTVPRVMIGEDGEDGEDEALTGKGWLT